MNFMNQEILEMGSLLSRPGFFMEVFSDSLMENNLLILETIKKPHQQPKNNSKIKLILTRKKMKIFPPKLINSLRIIIPVN